MRKEENPGVQTGALDRADQGQSSALVPAFVFDDAEDRELAEAERAVIGAGYRLAVQCLDCKSWLVSAKSVAAHRGPVCRGRRGGAE